MRPVNVDDRLEVSFADSLKNSFAHELGISE